MLPCNNPSAVIPPQYRHLRKVHYVKTNSSVSHYKNGLR